MLHGRRLSPRQIAIILIPALALASILTWVSSKTWHELQTLREEIAITTPDRFTVGLKLREGIGNLNQTLIQIQLTDSDQERERFTSQSQTVSNSLSLFKTYLQSSQEQEVLEQFRTAFHAYLLDTAPYQGRGIKGIRRWTASQLKEDITLKSSTLNQWADELVRRQQMSWHAVSERLQHTLDGMTNLWRGSLGALFTCILVLAWVVYRAWIAPLQSELDESQLLIQRQEKLAALGTLAAGVAHEIRNPLTAMKLRLFSLERSLPPELTPNEDLTILKGELQRLDRIVKDFLLFARPAEPDLRNVDLSQLFAEIQKLLSLELHKRGIHLQLDAHPKAQVIADSRQLLQVLINLVQNAADSISPPGTITLRTSTLPKTDSAHASSTLIEVIDTGAGISPENAARMFDPFFSTKPAGTGLGLPIASRIIEKHHGSIRFESQPGRGTTFQIQLPSTPL